MKTLGDSVKIDSVKDSMIDSMKIDSMKDSIKIDSMKGSKVSTDSKNSLKDSLMIDSLKDSKDSLMIDSFRFVSFPRDSPFLSSSLLPASRNRNSQAR